jgi:hypothetical protein
LSLGRTEEKSTIGGCGNIDLTVSKVILIPIMEYIDDQEEKDDHGPQY